MDETEKLSFPDVSKLSFSLKCNNSHTQTFILKDKVINTNIHPVAARQLYPARRFINRKGLSRTYNNLENAFKFNFPPENKWWWQFQGDIRFVKLKNKQQYNYIQYYTIIQRIVWGKLNLDPLGT